MKNMSERLQELIYSSDYSVEQLALKIGVTKNTIYNIFKGSDPKTSVITKLANELNTSIDYIVSGSEYDKDKIEADIISKFRQLDYDHQILIAKQITEFWIEEIKSKSTN